MRSRSWKAPAWWLVCLAISICAVVLAVLFAVQGDGRQALVFGIQATVWALNAWNFRRRAHRVIDEPARAAWDRIDDAEARLELYRRG